MVPFDRKNPSLTASRKFKNYTEILASSSAPIMKVYATNTHLIIAGCAYLMYNIALLRIQRLLPEIIKKKKYQKLSAYVSQFQITSEDSEYKFDLNDLTSESSPK